MRKGVALCLLLLAFACKSSAESSVAPCASDSCIDSATRAEIGDPCTSDYACASGMCDLTYPYGLCYATCQTDADCGDVTMKLCGADGRCYLSCTSDVDCEPGAATCVPDVPPRADGKDLCEGVPPLPVDGGVSEAEASPAGDAPAEASFEDAPSSDAPPSE